jgi:hypothetical protein
MIKRQNPIRLVNISAIPVPTKICQNYVQIISDLKSGEPFPRTSFLNFNSCYFLINTAIFLNLQMVISFFKPFYGNEFFGWNDSKQAFDVGVVTQTVNVLTSIISNKLHFPGMTKILISLGIKP